MNDQESDVILLNGDVLVDFLRVGSVKLKVPQSRGIELTLNSTVYIASERQFTSSYMSPFYPALVTEKSSDRTHYYYTLISMPADQVS